MINFLEEFWCGRPDFQVVNRRKTLYFVYNTVCKKQEGATDCVFCVF